jgi:hypothetical protein
VFQDRRYETQEQNALFDSGTWQPQGSSEGRFFQVARFLSAIHEIAANMANAFDR